MNVLNKDGQALLTEYYPYITRIEKIFIRKAFSRFILQGIVCDDDLEEAALVGCVEATPALLCALEKKISADGFNDVTHRDNFIKGWYSKVIYRRMCSALTKETSEQDNIECRLDDNPKDDSESTFHEYIPSKNIPIAKLVEHKILLETLMTDLTDTQIMACRLLCKGFGIIEAVERFGIAKSDIAVLRSYLWQLSAFGYVKNKIPELINLQKNVYFDNDTGKWAVWFSYKSRRYDCFRYYDYEFAAGVAREAEIHCIKGDLPEWYNGHLNGKKFVIKQLEDNSDFDYTIRKNRASVKYSSDGIVHGIQYNKETQRYRANIRGYFLAETADKNEAVKIRLEAEEHIKKGDFPVWLEQHRKNFRSNQIVYARIDADSNRYKIRVGRKSPSHIDYVGSAKTYDEALKIKDLADKHIESGDYEKWVLKFKEKRKKR